MVVGGVPEVSDEHAESVAGMALGMLDKSRKVMSPANNKPLQVPSNSQPHCCGFIDLFCFICWLFFWGGEGQSHERRML